MENHNYNKQLRPLANKLRKTMTKAEACLWKYALKAGQINGYGFRRQRPIGPYIVDFVCLPLKLIIEVDGITHTWENAIEKDIERENYLIHNGFVILRFWDVDVLKNIKWVNNQIFDKIKEIERS